MGGYNQIGTPVPALVYMIIQYVCAMKPSIVGVAFIFYKSRLRRSTPGTGIMHSILHHFPFIYFY